MNPKSAPRKWTDIQLAIAAVSMTSVLAFWNMFAGPDRSKSEEKAVEAQQASQAAPTPAVMSVSPAPTMPPAGYTILFGGTAPQPQVIVMQSGQGGNQGGGDPVTVTTSS